MSQLYTRETSGDREALADHLDPIGTGMGRLVHLVDSTVAVPLEHRLFYNFVMVKVRIINSDVSYPRGEVANILPLVDVIESPDWARCAVEQVWRR